ncbi:MAG: prepilin-type N-terminal cleavage/methylation domain-containing protein [Ignavibacteriales bacterium]
MKRGFTLVELMAVIIILSLLVILAAPPILEKLKKTEKDVDAASLALIESAIDLYIDDNDDTYPNINGSTYCITFQQLVNDGKLKPPVLNAKTGEEIDLNTLIEVKIINNNLNVSINNDCILYVNADLSGAAIPELSDGMIPIKWDGTNWVKADLYQKWYDYAAKEWANIVLVTEATRNTYKSASAGTIINEADVLAYLVWIPRYRYKLFNVEALSVSPQAIEIVFEDKNITKSNGSTNGTWLTHPAFTFGTSEVNGIWVGKFETTGDATTPTVKPNVASLTSQNVSTQFTTSQKFNTETTYGTTSDFNSHMMKSMEWGSVIYLSHSQYGKNSEIFINPSNSHITGRGGNTVSQSGTTDSSGSASSTLYSYDGKQCNTKTGYVCTGTSQSIYGMASSTTGNIYGIYDMSGGSLEYVMGAQYNSDNTTINVSSSGFVQTTIDSVDMAKYINKYTYGTTQNDQTAYNRRQLGDATGETRGWYDDYAGFVYFTVPWSVFGGFYNSTTLAGGFAFYNHLGGAFSNYSFRVVQLKQ